MYDIPTAQRGSTNGCHGQERARSAQQTLHTAFNTNTWYNQRSVDQPNSKR